jgi:hypothetical protein
MCDRRPDSKVGEDGVVKPDVRAATPTSISQDDCVRVDSNGLSLRRRTVKSGNVTKIRD